MAYEQTAEQVRAEHIVELGAKMGPVFSELRDDLAWLQVKWGEYRELFGTSPERIDLLNQAAGLFFRVLQDSLWDDALLHLCRMTDPAEMGGKRNLTIQALPDLCSDDVLRRDLSAAVEKAVDATKFARDWRNRRISHRDLDLVIDPTLKPLAPSSRADVTGAISAIHHVLNLICERCLRTTLADDVIGPSTGAEALLYVLKDGLAAGEARRKRIESGQFTQEDLGHEAV